MTQRFFGAAALMLALLMSNAAAAQTQNGIAPVSLRGYPWLGYTSTPIPAWFGMAISG